MIRYMDPPEVLVSYNAFLMDMIDAPDNYSRLMAEMDYKVFDVLVADDTNRVADAEDLREEFLYYEEIGGFRFSSDCSVLEVLIALSRRYDRMVNDPDEDRTDKYFWMMIKNLGLSKYDDRHFDVEEVEEILEKFVMRTYKRDGKGGIFPVKNCKDDMRKKELFAQMCAYMNEHEG